METAIEVSGEIFCSIAVGTIPDDSRLSQTVSSSASFWVGDFSDWINRALQFFTLPNDNACQMRSDLLPRSSSIQLGKPKVGFLTREKVYSFSGGKGAGTAPVLC